VDPASAAGRGPEGLHLSASEAVPAPVAVRRRGGPDDVAESRLPSSTVNGYGLIAGPFEMLKAPALAILPALYAKHYGLSLATISLALLLLRLSDGATDLVVGLLSDRTRSRLGPRKPWLLASVLVALPSAWGLYMPGETATIWQFALCYFFFYLAWTMFEIPYTAWSAELTHNYADRSRLGISRSFYAHTGLIILSLVPLLPFLPSTEMNFATLRVVFWIVAVLYPLGVLYAVLRVPTGELVASTGKVDLRATWRAVAANRPLQVFLGVALLSDLALGIQGALFFLLFDSYLGLGASFSVIFLTAIVAGTAALKPWQMLVQRTSKRLLLVTALTGAAVNGLFVFLLSPGPQALVLFIIFLALFYILSIGREVALYSMIGDVVDYDVLMTRENRAGQFTSAWLVLRKLAYAIAPAIGFFVAGAAGYDPAATDNDALGILGLKSANGYIPALLLACAAFVALRYPLTPRRHDIIRRRLGQRKARSTRQRPDTTPA
jgi:GPH family glycoside/pentoside/hexuronide:cation symporter